jgi:carnosine N-methyltransferase
VLSFLQIIYDLLDEGGIWINLGPLLWHFENSPTTSAKGEGSIELSLNEVKELARQVGFVIDVCFPTAIKPFCATHAIEAGREDD